MSNNSEKSTAMFFLGILCGMFIVTALINGPLEKKREKQSYINGVNDGSDGRYKIKIDSVMWHIEPIGSVRNR